MAWHLSQKDVSPIGIDLGTHSLKLLQVTTDQRPKILAAARADLPAETQNDIELRHQFIGTEINNLISKGQFRGKRTVISIPAAQTHVQHIRLPKNEHDENNDLLEAELQKRLPVDPSCLVIRTIPVGEVIVDGSAKQEVICLATGRQGVMQYINLFNKSKLQVVGMHCEPLAVVKSFAHLYRRESDKTKTTLFIDIGSTTTKALITHGGQLIFAKNIQVAANHLITQQTTPSTNLSDVLSNNNDTTQIIDIDNEPDMQTQTITTTLTEQPEPDTSTMIHSEMLDCLVDELQLCAGYYNSVFPNRAIDTIIFLGGLSTNTQICQRVAQSLRLPAQLGDPLTWLLDDKNTPSAIGVDLQQPQPGWATPLGLCLLPTNL